MVAAHACFPGAFELLDATCAGATALASVSNTNEIHWERFEREWTLDAALPPQLPVLPVGKLKPDADYFEHVLEALGVAPAQRVLFIDDNAINVDARRRGSASSRGASLGVAGRARRVSPSSGSTACPLRQDAAHEPPSHAARARARRRARCASR